MPLRIVSRKITIPSKGPGFIKFGVSMRMPVGLAEDMSKAADRANRHIAKEQAKRFFDLTQKNIVDMHIPDRNYLMKSGYIHSQDGNGDVWVVGYSDPKAWFVDLGTGPKAGHGPYSAPPPYPRIEEWVRRNIATLGLKEIRAKKGSAGETTVRFRRIKGPDGRSVYVIKPTKATPRMTHSWARAKSKGDEPEIIDTARKVQWNIYKHGTPPRPFWRKALAQVKDESRDMKATEYGREALAILKRGFNAAWRGALQRGLRVVGGSRL